MAPLISLRRPVWHCSPFCIRPSTFYLSRHLYWQSLSNNTVKEQPWILVTFEKFDHFKLVYTWTDDPPYLYADLMACLTLFASDLHHSQTHLFFSLNISHLLPNQSQSSFQNFDQLILCETKSFTACWNVSLLGEFGPLTGGIFCKRSNMSPCPLLPPSPPQYPSSPCPP